MQSPLLYCYLPPAQSLQVSPEDLQILSEFLKMEEATGYPSSSAGHT